MQVMQEALSLPNNLRLELVEQLLVEQLLLSFESDVDETAQAEWLAVAQRRRDEIRQGLVQPIPGDEVLFWQ